jgi:DNA mismatch endonuclease (patch repair protein)
MSQNRGKDTKPEIALRKALWGLGLRYRTHYKLPGRPDMVFVKQKVAIFVDGCYWHGCPEHSVMPKTNTSFWAEKFRKNKQRDKKNTSTLKESGWTVLRVWEHEIENDFIKVVESITKNLRRS